MAVDTAVPVDLKECIWHDHDGVWVDVDAIARDAVLEAEAAVAVRQVVVEQGGRVRYLPARPILVATTTPRRSQRARIAARRPARRGLYDVVLTPSVLDGEAASTMTTASAAALVQGARDRQRARRGDQALNGFLSGTAARMLVSDSAAQAALTDAVAAGHVHRRDEDRVVRVAGRSPISTTSRRSHDSTFSKP